MTENPYLSQLIDIAQVNSIDNLPLESFSVLSSGRFISSYYHMKKNGHLNKRTASLINEIELKEGEIAKAIKLLYVIHNPSCELKEDIKDIKNYLDNGYVVINDEKKDACIKNYREKVYKESDIIPVKIDRFDSIHNDCVLKVSE